MGELQIRIERGDERNYRGDSGSIPPVSYSSGIWAITIHKSQGLTFERAIIDARNSFAHGQTYVALSRCKTLEGMVLESPLRREAIISDSVVDNFTKGVEQNKPGSKQLNDMQKAYFFDLLSDLFNFYAIEQAYKRLLRMMDEDLYRLFPEANLPTTRHWNPTSRKG